MREVVIKLDVPEDLKEVVEIPELDLSLAVGRVIKSKLVEIAEIERILSKSKLSEERSKEIADEISSSMAKEYWKLYEELKG